MGATVRESDDSEPSKNEPLNSEPSKSEPWENEPLKHESLKHESLKHESLRSELSKGGPLKRESLKRESLNRPSSKIEPSKNQPSKNEPRNVDGGPSGRATEVPEPLWKRKARREVFEGDVAVVELRSRLALAPERILEPPAPNSTVPTVAALLRLTGGVLVAAAVAGVTGYLGVRLSTKSPQLAPATGQANVLPTVATPAANFKISNPDSERRSGPAAAIGAAPVDAHGAADDVASVDAAQQPLPSATGPRSVAPSSPFPPPAPVEDASEIAAKMMANGDIFRQFMLWREQQQRKR